MPRAIFAARRTHDTRKAGNNVFGATMAAGRKTRSAVAGFQEIRYSGIQALPVAIALEKILEFTRGIFLRNAVTLLNHAFVLIECSRVNNERGVDQLAPTDFQAADDLLPVAGDTIVIHPDLHLMCP
jgi:hypothetical protein